MVAIPKTSKLGTVGGGHGLLDDTVILGLTTNIDFLKAVIEHPAFIEGKLHTGFIPRYLPDWKPHEPSEDELMLALALASLPSERKTATVGTEGPTIPDPWLEIGSWQFCSGGAR